MGKFIVNGGTRLSGRVRVSGAKNVAMKVILASLLTDGPMVIENIPLISSVLGTIDVVQPLGVEIVKNGHTLKLQAKKIHSHTVPLEMGGLYRTAPMVLAPLLARVGKGIVPNPGGCRLGKRPIDRHIEALQALGAKIVYRNGFFHASSRGLKGTRYKFHKNTHTGTETVILAAVLAEGTTIIENAAVEPEVDDLIKLLNLMGAKIVRPASRTIKISGVQKLHGAHYQIMPDRNEVVTFAIAALVTRGEIIVEGTVHEHLRAFFDVLGRSGGGWEKLSASATRFFYKQPLKASDILTGVYPEFMTDWQAPWTLLMTQAQGKSVVHETIYEHRFGFVTELRKMGAKIDFFHPKVDNPADFYNFNWSDKDPNDYQGIIISGPTQLHNAVVDITDLRAGATLLLAAISAQGTSVLHGIEHIDRGYEDIEGRLQKLGAEIKRTAD